jgi:hypothetical protein
MTDLEAAWTDVHDATPPGWYVGRPSYRDALKAWEQYAYMPAESRRGVGHRAHEWTAVGQTEVEVPITTSGKEVGDDWPQVG